MRYAAGRIVYLLIIVLAVTFFVSAMLELMPGDPAIAVLGDTATPEQIDAFHERMHLDEPVLERYLTWLGNAVRGDLGNSVRGNTPMTEIIRERAPVTLQLVVFGQMLALLVAVPTAIYAAYRPGRLVDNLTSAWSFGVIAAPSFVVALVLMLVFSVRLGWFPVVGFTPLTEDLWENLRSVTLPLIVVASHPAAIYQRLLRSDVRATLREDYIAMAEAKGQSTLRILFRHALRPSLLSLVTLFGVSTASAIGGSVIVETVFGLPGLGRLMLDSIQLRDVAAVQAIVAVIAVGYVVINGLVDILYGVLDPRIRRAG